MAIDRGQLLERPVNRKSASLFVIACEGEVTEKAYFEGLVEVFNLQRVQVKMLDAGRAGRSSPLAVLRRMDKYVKGHEEQLKEGDEFWLVMDVEQTEGKHQHNLVRAVQKAGENDYSVAVSNPRIELWLLLHLEECPSAEDCAESKWLEKRISQLASFNSKHGVHVEKLKEGVSQAIERARALDQVQGVLPTFPGTQVYRLMEAIRQTEARPTTGPPF